MAAREFMLLLLLLLGKSMAVFMYILSLSFALSVVVGRTSPCLLDLGMMPEIVPHLLGDLRSSLPP